MQHTTISVKNELLKTDAETFAIAIQSADHGQLYRDLYKHFCDEMYKAVKDGRICTPERMAALYPVFREINVEQDEIKVYWDDFERKDARRQERKALKAVEVQCAPN